MEVDQLSLERIIKVLIGLGLSQTDAEIYVHLATAGPATARIIVNSLIINKRQIYRSLKALQQKGIVSGSDGYPAEFSVVSFEKALDLLLEVKKEQAKSLEASKAEIVADFQTEKKKSKESN
jgi:sugar-specific transcriptional regulator TrmB